MSGELNFTNAGARRAVPWTQLHDWVRISGITPTAASLYWVIKMHVYVRSGDNTVTTTMDTLASFCGLSRGDKATRYMRELEGIGAISSELVGMPARKVYTVHEEPPEGYTGPLTLKEWYKIRKAVKAFKEAGDAEEKPQVNAVTPSGGEQRKAGSDDSTKPQVNPVPPSRGEQALFPPGGGSPVAPSRGHKQEAVFEQGATSASSPASPHGASTENEQEEKQNPSEPENQKPDGSAVGAGLTEEERELVAECLRLRPDWSPSRLREVVADPDVRDRPDRDLVRRAFLLGARTSKTQPGRMLASGCPHWAEALKERNDELRAAAPRVPSQADSMSAPPAQRTKAADSQAYQDWKAAQAAKKRGRVSAGS